MSRRVEQFVVRFQEKGVYDVCHPPERNQKKEKIHPSIIVIHSVIRLENFFELFVWEKELCLKALTVNGLVDVEAKVRPKFRIVHAMAVHNTAINIKF